MTRPNLGEVKHEAGLYRIAACVLDMYARVPSVLKDRALLFEAINARQSREFRFQRCNFDEAMDTIVEPFLQQAA